jgi:hypothetical protein
MEKIKDISVIPQGVYCYTYLKDGSYYVCPYWSKIEGGEEQADGYCAFLEKGDLDIQNEQEFKDLKTGEITKGSELPFATSLLWDQVKECGINDDYKGEN